MQLRTLFRIVSLLAWLCCLGLCCGPGGADRDGEAVLEDERIRLEVTSAAGLKVSFKDGRDKVLLASGSDAAFSLVDTGGRRIRFVLKEVQHLDRTSAGIPAGGRGIRLVLVPPEEEAFLAGVVLEAELCLQGSRAGVVVGRVNAVGFSAEVLSRISGTRFFAMSAAAGPGSENRRPWEFHLFQGPVYKWGEWYTKIELHPDYNAPNWTIKHGERQIDGGGLPLVYLWTRDAGLALAHVDTVHRVAALPVTVVKDRGVELAFERPSEFLRPDAHGRLRGVPVMIGAFQGDYFQALRSYGALLQEGGLHFSPPPPEAYEPIWCSWGFERDVVPDDILRTLPEVKNLGIPWVVMDDGYQSSIGDWPLDERKFPRGDADMRALVDSIHAAGMKAKLWWVPMNVSPDDPLYEEHPDWVVLDREGQPKREPWWNVFQLCPAVPGVVKQQRALVRRFMETWGYDGFKMDGSCLGMTTPCYNPAHHHQRPEESCEAVAAFFAAIKAEAESIRPTGCVLEVCECGIPHNPFKMPYYNQQVSADPVSSDQVRARIKMYHALLGHNAAPYGDHVELSTGPSREGEELVENGRDFAGTLALGGIIGTKFTALVSDTEAEGLDWKEYKGIRSHWEHWFGLYNALRLFDGEYTNLYDIAYDTPETHVVVKGDTLYYGMFAAEYSGEVQLRGLQQGRQYALTEYDRHDRPLGEVAGGEKAALACEFSGHFLVRAVPVQ